MVEQMESHINFLKEINDLKISANISVTNLDHEFFRSEFLHRRKYIGMAKSENILRMNYNNLIENHKMQFSVLNSLSDELEVDIIET
ncbi:2725_t:CDS:2 [Entrophospora sp. SA101]|nr:2725_t:CDS:2 [Entrophospora sp. SA101]